MNLKYLSLGIAILIVVGSLLGYFILTQETQSPTPKTKELLLSDYPEVFKENTIIVIGDNASQVEKESAQEIAKNLEDLTANKPEIVKDIEMNENLKNSFNIIVVGKPESNRILEEVYSMAEVVKVSEEYPGEGKGILEIAKNPWNESKALLLVEGSDEWGVRAGSEMLTNPQKLEGKYIEVPSKVKTIEGMIKQVSFASAKMWVIQTEKGDMYIPIGNRVQEVINLGEGVKVKIKGYVTVTKISVPEAGEFHSHSQKAIEVISYDLLKKESTSPQPKESTSTEEIDISDWKTYRNEEYGFEIKYPPDYSVFEGEVIEINRPLSKEGYSAGAKIYLEKNRVDFPAIGVSFPNILSLSFKDFAAYAAREHCFVQGSMGTVSCDKVLEETSFELPNGIKGYKIYLNLVSCGADKDEKGEIIEKCSNSKKGPIFALDISEKTNNQLRGIFIEPFLLLSDLTKQQKGEEDTKRNLEQMISTVKFFNK